MSRLLIVMAAVCLLLAGCGEMPQATVYKQGQYQGKPDKQPWDNTRFKNDQMAWDKAIKARNVVQNEYVRIGSN